MLEILIVSLYDRQKDSNMNIANLILQLESKISNNTLDQQMISKAIRLLEVGAVKVVGSPGELPDPAATPLGELYFVEGSYLYYNSGTSWNTFFSVETETQTENTVWGWGTNFYGIIGDGTYNCRTSPFPTIGGFTDWSQVAAGAYHSVGLRSNGTIWAWGANGTYGVGITGQLGNNSGTFSLSPVSVVGGITDWCQIAAGAYTTLALRTNGTAWTWGLNYNGDLLSKSSPVPVVGGFTDWVSVHSGDTALSSFGIRSDGSAWGWGQGQLGKLGNGTTITRSSPVSVVGGFTWSQIAAGRCHTIGLRCNGTAWAWGANGLGRLGDGTTVNKSSPVAVVGGFSDWCQIAAGAYHSAGIRTNGTAWSWGFNNSGRLGDGTTVNKSSPVSVVGGFTDWCKIESGFGHVGAIRTNGTAWAWGDNSRGALGDGTTVTRSSPVSVLGGFTDWCDIAGSSPAMIALRSRPI